MTADELAQRDDVIEHTKDLWTTERGPIGEEVVSLDRNNHSTFVANCGMNADSVTKALRIVADHKAALTAPHECSDLECPGNVNRRKLEAFDGLLAVTLKTEAWLHRPSG